MGGQGADIAQQVMTLIDKQQSDEDQQEESSPTESENKPDSNEPAPATDETESGSTLMKALPAAAATPHPGETKH